MNFCGKMVSPVVHRGWGLGSKASDLQVTGISQERKALLPTDIHGLTWYIVPTVRFPWRLIMKYANDGLTGWVWERGRVHAHPALVGLECVQVGSPISNNILPLVSIKIDPTIVLDTCLLVIIIDPCMHALQHCSPYLVIQTSEKVTVH